MCTKMKEFLKKMKDPQYKFFGYILGLFIMFIIALCLPKNNSNTVNTINNDKDTPNTTDNKVLEFLNNQEDYTYNFKYVLKVNDQTITYQGQKTNNEEYITIEGNSYLIKDSLIYIKSGDIYQIYNDNIYTNKMELFTNGKILTNYINKGYLKDNTYLINLKDIIYNYEDKIKYLYFEYFGKFTTNPKEALARLKQEINNEPFNDNLKYFFKLSSNHN